MVMSSASRLVKAIAARAMRRGQSDHPPKRQTATCQNQKPRGLGGSRVVARPALELPEPSQGGDGIAGDSGDNPGGFRS